MEYQLITSARRKTICLVVESGKVKVRAPISASKEVIENLLAAKKTWLKAKISQQSGLVSKQATFTHNSHLWIDGKCKTLLVDFGQLSDVIEYKQTITVVIKGVTDNNSGIADVNRQQVKTALEKWLQKKAQEYIPLRINELSQQSCLYPETYNIKKYKARWGSCNSKSQLCFNYLLMMTPKSVIDYVIVHELCHLKYLNHSNNFWLLVNKHYPEYRQAKLWLKQHQHHLNWSL
jgi:hypothetical protein